MISRNNFILKEIPNLIPDTTEYFNFWRTHKRRCIEGYWVGGKWMPGPLYFYVNFWHILLNKSKHSKVKSLAKPYLRDIEWDKAYVYMEAKGFSGFKEDEKETCYRPLKKLITKHEKFKEREKLADYPEYKEFPPEVFSSSGKLKAYIEAREYLRRLHKNSLGKPLFQNEAKNVCDIECLEESQIVLMADFTRKMIKDVQVGEELMGLSAPTKVISKVTGANQMFKITTKRGHTQVVTGNHLVPVKVRTYVNGKLNKEGIKEKGHYIVDYRNVRAEDLYAQSTKASFRNKYKLYRSFGVDFDSVPDKDSYLLGLWLSDGRTDEASITMCDLEPLEYVAKLTDKPILQDKPRTNRKSSYTIYFGTSNIFGVGKKYIPTEYLTSSRETRLQLLAGVIDGDGWQQHNMYRIGEPNKELALQYSDLAQSLGFYSTVAERKSKSGSILYEVSVGGDVFQIPVKIPRKAVEYTKKTTTYTSESFSIEMAGLGNFVGLEVDADDHLFLLSDWVSTHNCRGSGKSYLASGMLIAHNFLMDGATDYDEYLQAWEMDKPFASETVVGAINTSYSDDLLSKFTQGLENLEGGVKIGNKYYPSPLHKSTKGTLAPGKNPLIAAFDKKVGGTWQEFGSRSKIHHRSFKDKPTAANGTRPGLVILEEVGFMGNLRDALGPLRMCTADGAMQFGVTYMFGTGGDMEGGSTEAVMEVFYDPEAWDCLAFPDYYEGNGEKNIGYFVPYTLGLNQFKDEEGNTNLEAANAFIQETRDELAKASSKKPLNDELQNNPVVHSEAFLVTSGNIFPIKELSDQLKFVESSSTDFIQGQLGTLALTPSSSRGVKFIPDIKNELRAATYPVKKGEDMPGAVQIWEHPPSGDIPYGMYVAGTDPYDQDRAEESASLGSTFIYKIGDFREGGLRDMIVAEYTGRPETAKEHHETVRRLLMYYNALDLYENERNTLKFHFDTENSLSLLSYTPSILKATANSTVNRQYGIHMTKAIKEELEVYARDWLTESIGDGYTNVNRIYSKGLLKELIMYNEIGNFDRVIAFLLTICNRMNHHYVKIEEKKKEIELDTFFTQKHFR